MIAFKGFTKNLTARLGKGEFQYEPGKTYEETESKTARTGFHCCENPFECLSYYHLNESDRFFQIEAEGDINEDSGERIACTKITLKKELSNLELAMYGMAYIIQHPDREKWQQNYRECKVLPDEAEADEKGHIAIARGADPVVSGPEGSILGLLKNGKYGIEHCKILVTPPQLAGKRLHMTQDGIVEVVS